ncbi:MAG: hypothetical protein KF904_22255 [Rhodoblastus sp.]|nr:hypothetical protein [Rhodoblastus sp.]MCC0004695.1 hypothetical protein [Methylobacteriaceae bacterium]
MNRVAAFIAAELAFSSAVLVGLRPSDEAKAARSAAIDARKAEAEAAGRPTATVHKAIVTRAGQWRMTATPADVADALAMLRGETLTGPDGEKRYASVTAQTIIAFADAFSVRADKSMEDLAASDRSAVVLSFDALAMRQVAEALNEADVDMVANWLENVSEQSRQALVAWDVAQTQARQAAREENARQREMSKAA